MSSDEAREAVAVLEAQVGVQPGSAYPKQEDEGLNGSRSKGW